MLGTDCCYWGVIPSKVSHEHSNEQYGTGGGLSIRISKMEHPNQMADKHVSHLDVESWSKTRNIKKFRERSSWTGFAPASQAYPKCALL